MKYGKHGQSYRQLKSGAILSTPEYVVWRNIKYRCHNPNAKNYRNYGGRGIDMCQRWQDSFLSFLEDVGKRPDGVTGKVPKYSIDRINNDGNYEPGNVRWATRKEQIINRRTGFKRSEEAIRNMRIAARNRGPRQPHSLETKLKMSLGHRLAWAKRKSAMVGQ